MCRLAATVVQLCTRCSYELAAAGVVLKGFSFYPLDSISVPNGMVFISELRSCLEEKPAISGEHNLSLEEVSFRYVDLRQFRSHHGGGMMFSVRT